MSEREYLAHDLALVVEINEQRKRSNIAEREILDANIEIMRLEKERIVLRQQYAKSKQGGQNHD